MDIKLKNLKVQNEVNLDSLKVQDEVNLNEMEVQDEVNLNEMKVGVEPVQVWGETVVFDKELSETSTNAVQNKVITAELKKKQNTDSVITNWDIEEILRS